MKEEDKRKQKFANTLLGILCRKLAEDPFIEKGFHVKHYNTGGDNEYSVSFETSVAKIYIRLVYGIEDSEGTIVMHWRPQDCVDTAIRIHLPMDVSSITTIVSMIGIELILDEHP
tara:strand:+ start:577 stop:921 length:345 start_codon:yes stop_codon:yes gene_type:complete